MAVRWGCGVLDWGLQLLKGDVCFEGMCVPLGKVPPPGAQREVALEQVEGPHLVVALCIL